MWIPDAQETNEPIFQKEYAAVKLSESVTYLQL
jgi:hypothetical protein